MGVASGKINKFKQKRHNPLVLKTKAKLLAFNINTYDYQGQLTDHKEIEALIETKKGYCVIRLSYANNGLTTYSMRDQRETSSTKCQKFKIKQFLSQSAWDRLIDVAKKYDRKEYSLLFANCQTFVEEIRDSLKLMGSIHYLDVWDLYDKL